jgi:hypothetical protein
MNQFFLQKTDGKFDRVDQFVYDRWEQAVDKGGENLYTGIGFQRTKNGPMFMGCPNWRDFTLMLRVLDVKPYDGIITGGIFKEPEFIRIKPKTGKGKTQVYEIQHEVQS